MAHKIDSYRAAVALYFLPLYLSMLMGPILFADYFSQREPFLNWPALPLSFLNPEGALRWSHLFLWGIGFTLSALVLFVPLFLLQRRHLLPGQTLSFWSSLASDPFHTGKTNLDGKRAAHLYLAFLGGAVSIGTFIANGFSVFSIVNAVPILGCAIYAMVMLVLALRK